MEKKTGVFEGNKKYYYIGGAAAAVLAVLLFFLLRSTLSNQIALPYIAHQKPRVDPHLPDAVALSDKLDEVVFDGLFNISANPSGITYEDGLGELIGIDENDVVTVRLKPKKLWHNSFLLTGEDGDITVSEAEKIYFTEKDLRFTLRRIEKLGSLSPDYILVSQALKQLDFEGPDANNEIHFQFKQDRIWTEADIKEVLSFKILPYESDINASHYPIGTGPYATIHPKEEVSDYYANPTAGVTIPYLSLKPFIDNSTFITEFKNNNINVLLSTPFGAMSPLLEDPEDYFYKSNISTTFFVLLFNTERLNITQRKALRSMIDQRVLINRFFKVGTEQQRHITDYKGNKDNYADYLNYSIFPSSTYYVDEEIVMPVKQIPPEDLSVLPDTIRVQVCLNYGHREELSELAEILNDRSLFKRTIKVTAVQNEDLKKGNYDTVLLAFSGYKSNFLFDLYSIFMREPDLATYKINLKVNPDGSVNPATWRGDNNFCRLSTAGGNDDPQAVLKLLDYMHGFMSSREIGDKQAYARFIDEMEYDMALGKWLFSLPSLAYFSTQFDAASIDLYGVASQLSTIEKWRERED